MLTFNAVFVLQETASQSHSTLSSTGSSAATSRHNSGAWSVRAVLSNDCAATCTPESASRAVCGSSTAGTRASRAADLHSACYISLPDWAIPSSQYVIRALHFVPVVANESTTVPVLCWIASSRYNYCCCAKAPWLPRWNRRVWQGWASQRRRCSQILHTAKQVLLMESSTMHWH